MTAHGKVWIGNGDLKSVNSNCLETVRVLHQTVVCLRKALERSQSELQLLKSKVLTESTDIKYNNTIEQLALENHVLRRKILSEKYFDNFVENNEFSMDSDSKSQSNEPTENNNDNTYESTNDLQPQPSENILLQPYESLVNNDVEESGNFYKHKTDSEESEEVDDIELIFTTGDTKIGLQEELESISDTDDIYESKSEINQQIVVTQSVLVETDISKCGIVCDNDNALSSSVVPTLDAISRRNVMQREYSLDKKISKLPYPFIKPPVIQTQRPVLTENNGSVRDSEAQTDISAVPPHWKSESFLVNNKSSQNFPTLPSKFAIPVKEASQKYPLKLTDKTQEARRILLSDINFTSMVPELSRSVDHLCQNGMRLPSATTAQSPFAVKYLKNPAFVSNGSSYSRFEFNIGNSNWNCYDNTDQDRSTQDLHARRRQSWRPSMYSLDTYCANRTSSVPPSPTLRRHSAAISYSPNNMDTQFYYPLPDKFNVKTFSNTTLKNVSTTSMNRKSKAKVSFKESCFSKNTGSRQSLPNMYVDTESGEESTESLIDESEECVRKSIETTLNSIDWPYVGYRYVGRTYSVPNLFLEFSPPLSARPFIARSPTDLKMNYFVKVINKEGRVVGGRIQFVGTVAGKMEPYVGILLPPNMGETDGSFQGLRYFTCERNCGLFVPFRKVVMAWMV